MSKGMTMAASGGGTNPGTVHAFVRHGTTVWGTGWTKVVASPLAGRAGLWVWNSSNAFQVCCLVLPLGAPAPAGADLTDGILALSPRQSVFLDLSEEIDLYAMHDAGPALVCAVVATEVTKS